MLFDPVTFDIATVSGQRVISVASGLASHALLSAAVTDTTPAAVQRGDLIVGIGATPTWTRLARSVPAANVLNVLGLANGDNEPAWKTVLDATNPANVTLTAAPGTSLVFAHRDHGHALDVAIAPTWTGLHTFGGSHSIGQLGAQITLSPSITQTNTAASAMHIGASFIGASSAPIALLIRPLFNPSAPIAEAFGASLAGIHNGGTITDLVGFRPIIASFVNTGAVTNFKAIRADAPQYTGTVRPTNAYGIDIQNQGVAGITNAIGICIRTQAGASNNFDVFWERVDTAGGGGAYYSRIPCLMGNGLTKYLRLYDS